MKKILLSNFLASGWGKISTVLFRLVQVPVLLSLLGVEDYGRWLVLYTLPSWISLANFGFGSVAGNEMSIAIGEGNLEKARKVFSSTMFIFFCILFGGLLIILPVLSLLHWESFLKLAAGRHREIQWVLIWFTLSTLLSFFGEIYQARFRAARKAHQFIILYSFRPWIELLSIIIVLHFNKRLDLMALAVCITTTCYVLATKWISQRALPELRFKASCIDRQLLKPLFKKGFAFQAFPLGNALIYQGALIIVQLILGSYAVAVFGSVRTLVRSINQMFELINQTLWPELSILFGAGSLDKIARLHRLGVLASIGVALISVLFLWLFGDKLFALWTGGIFPLSKTLLLFFLLPIPFNSLWFTSSVIHMASNQHEGLAIRYMLAMIFGAAACAALSYFFGIAGAAISTVIADLVLIPYVFKKSLTLSNDTPAAFLKNLFNDYGLILKQLKSGYRPFLNHNK